MTNRRHGPLACPKGNPIRAIEYHDEVPHGAVVNEGGGDSYYDFAWCARDGLLYWHCSGRGPRTPYIELTRMAFPEEAPAGLWLAAGEQAAMAEVPPRPVDEAGLRAAGYKLIRQRPTNPFTDAYQEDKCYPCEWCDDWLPHDRPCHHLCNECNEPAPKLLAGYCGACCDVELDGERIWRGSHAQWVVRFDEGHEPYEELLDE